MSTPPTDSELDPGTSLRRFRPKRTEFLVFVVLPVAIGILVLILTGSARRGVESNLQIFAPSAALSSARLPVRVFIFDGISQPSTAERMQVPVRVSIRRGPEELASAELSISKAWGMEGMVELPDLPVGSYELVAEGFDLSMSQPLTVVDELPPPELQPRSALPLQRFREFPTRRTPGPEHDRVRDPRLGVPGGICVPELACDVVLRIAEPNAEVRIRPSPGFDSEDAEIWATPVAGFVRKTIITHGLDLQVTLEVRIAGEMRAERTFQIPMGLGSFQAQPTSRRLRPDEQIQLRFEGVRDGVPVIVDVFDGSYWAFTTSFSADEVASGTPLALPFDLYPGLFRVQARSAATDSELSTTYRVQVANENGIRTDDGFAFDFSAGELGVLEHPPPSNSMHKDRAAFEATQENVRKAISFTVLLIGVLVIVFVIRLGLRSSGEARKLMATAGDTGAQTWRKRATMTLTVVLMASLLALLFAFAALTFMIRW